MSSDHKIANSPYQHRFLFNFGKLGVTVGSEGSKG
jgi:hypothetical protein